MTQPASSATDYRLTDLEAAAIRWKNSHPDQLIDGDCAECSVLWKAIFAFINAPVPEPASTQSASVRRFEEKPVAWLIERPKGTGKQQTTELEVVLSPLTDDTFMDEGDSAYPLFREVYTQEGIDAAKAEAARLIKGLNIE